MCQGWKCIFKTAVVPLYRLFLSLSLSLVSCLSFSLYLFILSCHVDRVLLVSLNLHILSLLTPSLILNILAFTPSPSPLLLYLFSSSLPLYYSVVYFHLPFLPHSNVFMLSISCLLLQQTPPPPINLRGSRSRSGPSWSRSLLYLC